MTNSTKFLAAMGIVAGLAAVTALPGIGNAADPAPISDTTEINVTIEETLSFEATTSVAGTIAGGDPIATLTDTSAAPLEKGVGFIVATNHSTGYNVTATMAPNTNLVNAKNDTIPYGTPAQGDSYWDIKKGDQEPTESWTHVDFSTGTAVVDTQNTPTLNAGKFTHLRYDVSAKDGQAAGTYAGVVTYTAAVK